MEVQKLLFLLIGMLQLTLCVQQNETETEVSQLTCQFGCIIQDEIEGKTCGSEDDCNAERVEIAWFLVAALACCIPTTIFCGRLAKDHR